MNLCIVYVWTPTCTFDLNATDGLGHSELHFSFLSTLPQNFLACRWGWPWITKVDFGVALHLTAQIHVVWVYLHRLAAGCVFMYLRRSMYVSLVIFGCVFVCVCVCVGVGVYVCGCACVQCSKLCTCVLCIAHKLCVWCMCI